MRACDTTLHAAAALEPEVNEIGGNGAYDRFDVSARLADRLGVALGLALDAGWSGPAERPAPKQPTAPPSKRDGALGELPVAFKRHFTPQELAQRWVLDESTIRRLFIDEPGVLKIGKSNRRDGKRDYVTLRIPESVVGRVHRERSKRTFKM